MLPKDNEIMRAFYHFIGTAIHRESRWFRPLAEEIPFPIADWNGNALDNENIYEGGQESEEQMEVSEADLLKRKGKRMTTLKKKAKLRKKCCHHFEKV